MHGNEPRQPVNLLICEQRCSDGFRQLAERNNWTLLEGAEPIIAARASVAIGPDRVCVEFTRSPASVPDIIRRLGALDSVGRVACLINSPPPALDADLSKAGAIILTTIREAESWLRGTHESPQTTATRSRSRPQFRVVPRDRSTEHSGFS